MSHGGQHPNGRPAPAAPMSRETAEKVLRDHGLDAAGLAPSELRRRRQDLARRHHHDLGGDVRSMQEINAAYSFLKPQAAEGRRDDSSPRVNGSPAWAWAGHHGASSPDELILREDYSDRNYLKKRLWELSGRSKEEWTLWAFDGQELLPPVTTYGCSAIFPEMAKAMLRHGRRGFRWPRAILAQAPSGRHELLVLHSDGRAQQPPVPLPLSCAGGPAHDRAFLMGLPGRLDSLAAGRAF